MIDQQILSWISKGYYFKVSPHATGLRGFSASIFKPNVGRSCSRCLSIPSGTWSNCGHGFTIPEAIKNELARINGKEYKRYTTGDFYGRVTK